MDQFNEETVVESLKDKRNPIASRGVPSSETLYLPSHYGGEVKKFQEGEEAPTKFHWELEDVLNFVFAKRYQRKYYDTALAFMHLLKDKNELDGTEINEFVRVNNISKATFYNRVLPRLKRVGMVKVERDTIIAQESKRKYRPMRISLSKTFGNYLNKIGESWIAVVEKARSD